ncbi:unnamed protein product, partial [marine sediment metagenome]
QIVWISHSEKMSQSYESYIISSESIHDISKLSQYSREDQILYTLTQIKHINCIKIIAPLRWIISNLSSNNKFDTKDKNAEDQRTSLSVEAFIKENYNFASEAQKIRFTGEIFLNYQEFQEAQKFFERLYDLGEKANDFTVKQIALIKIGVIHNALGNISRSLEYFEKTTLKSGDWSFVNSNSLFNIGLIVQKQGNYLKALEIYEQSLNLAQKEQKLSQQAIVLQAIGNVYYEQENLPKASEYFEESLLIYRKIGDLKGIA